MPNSVSPMLPLVLLLFGKPRVVANFAESPDLLWFTYTSPLTLAHLSSCPVPATRRSQARASSRPPPKANPSMAAIVGAGKAAVEMKNGSACEALA